MKNYELFTMILKENGSKFTYNGDIEKLTIKQVISTISRILDTKNQNEIMLPINMTNGDINLFVINVNIIKNNINIDINNNGRMFTYKEIIL